MKGKALIFSAPSGAGKTTMVRHLLQKEELRLRFSISATTREAREHEENGNDYYFMSVKEFLKNADEGNFLEWEEVYQGQYYGTLRKEIERIWSDGNHAIFDVDVVGGLELKETFGDQALAVFISPPNISTLEERLRSRGTESDSKINTRLQKAKFEMSFADRFDLVIHNEVLEHALQEAERKVKEFIEL